MNSTFKVVFNKARGALMVVNEVTSSVQAKGTKTVVATAVAAMIAGVAGTAVAEVPTVTWDSETVPTLSDKAIEISGKDLTGGYYTYLNINDGAKGTLKNAVIDLKVSADKDTASYTQPSAIDQHLGSNVTFAGDVFTVTSKTDLPVSSGGNDSVYGIWQGGGEMTVTAKTTNITVESTAPVIDEETNPNKGKAVFAVTTKGTMTFSGETVNVSVKSDTSRLEKSYSATTAIVVTNAKDSEGNVVSEGKLVTDKNTVLNITGVTTSNKATTPTTNPQYIGNEAGGSPLTGISLSSGSADVKGKTNINLTTNAGKATGIEASNYSVNTVNGVVTGEATGKFGAVDIAINSQSGDVYGVQTTAPNIAVTDAVLLDISGDTVINAVTEKGNAYGVAILGTQTVNLNGNANIKAETSNDKSEAYSIKVVEGGVLNLGGVKNELTGDALVDGTLNLTNGKGTTNVNGSLILNGSLTTANNIKYEEPLVDGEKVKTANAGEAKDGLTVAEATFNDGAHLNIGVSNNVNLGKLNLTTGTSTVALADPYVTEEGIVNKVKGEGKLTVGTLEVNGNTSASKTEMGFTDVKLYANADIDITALNVVADNAVSGANDKKGSNAKLVINGSKKVTVKDAINLQGIVSAEDSGNDRTVVLGVNMTAADDVKGKHQYNFVAENGMTIGQKASFNVNDGNVLVGSDVTVNDGGTLWQTAKTQNKSIVTINGALNVAKKATVQLNKIVELDSLVNESTGTKFGTVTIANGGSNVGKITVADTATIGGTFDNKFIAAETEAGEDIVGKIEATKLTVAENGIFNNAGELKATTGLTLDKSAQYNNTGKTEVGVLALKEGAVYNTALQIAHATFEGTNAATVKLQPKELTNYTDATTVEIDKNAVFNIAEKNHWTETAVSPAPTDPKAVTHTYAADGIQLDGTWKLNGGAITLDGSSLAEENVWVNGELALNGSDLEIAKLDVSEAKLTVGKDADLTVDRLITGAQTEDAKKVTVGAGGWLEIGDTLTLTVSDQKLNYVDGEGTSAVKTAFEGIAKNDGEVFVTINADGNLAFKDFVDTDTNPDDDVVTNGVGIALKDKFGIGTTANGTGLVYVEGLKVTVAEGTKLTESQAKHDLGGLVIEGLDGLTVSGVTSLDGLKGSYSNLEVANGYNDSVVFNGTIVLNGSGDLIAKVDAEGKVTDTYGIVLGNNGSFIYDGGENAAQIDGITGTGNVEISTGDLTVAGDVVGAKLTVGDAELEEVGSVTVNGDVAITGGVAVDAGSAITVNGNVDATTLVAAGDVTVAKPTAEGAEDVELNADAIVISGGEFKAGEGVATTVRDGIAITGADTVANISDLTVEGTWVVTDARGAGDPVKHIITDPAVFASWAETIANEEKVTFERKDASVTVADASLTADKIVMGNEEGKAVLALGGEASVKANTLTTGSIIGVVGEGEEQTFVGSVEASTITADTITVGTLKSEGTVTAGAVTANTVELNNAAVTSIGAREALTIAGTANVAETVISLGAISGEGELVAGGDVNGVEGIELGALRAANVQTNKVFNVADATVNGNLTAVEGIKGEDLAVTGDAGTNGSVEVTTAAIDGKLTVAGGEAKDVKAEALTVGSIETTNAAIDVTNLTVNAVGSIRGGLLKAETLTNAGTVDLVAAAGEVETLAGNGLVNVGNDEYAGALKVGTVNGGVIYADPALGENGLAFNEASQVTVAEVTGGGVVHAGTGSIATVGGSLEKLATLAVQAGADKLTSDGYNSILYVAPTATAIDGIVVATGEETNGAFADYGNTNGLFTAGSTLLVLDANDFGAGQLFEGEAEIKVLGDMYIANAKAGQELVLADRVVDAEINVDGIKLDYSRIIGADIEGNKLVVDVKDDLNELNAAKTIETVKSFFANGAEGTSTSALFHKAMFDNTNAGMSDKVLAQALDDVAGIGATAGMASVTMDALSAFNDIVANRTSILAPAAEGTTLWADVNAGRYEAKRLFNGAGYSSDIYAGAFGVDTVVACGAKVGAAFTFGNADTDSKNTTAVTSMDSDFVGLSIYTAKQFGEANVAIDLGYLKASNDVSAKAYNDFGLGKFSADSDAITFGVRGELLTKAGSFNVVPHAGLRWTKLSVDSFEAGYKTDIDDMNVFQLPIGITVAGSFEGAGFTWAPAFDLSFVPAFGDKDADMTLGIAGASQTSAYGVQVIDSNPVQATIGLDATNGAWAFGLNYKLGAGSDGRMNNSFNANVRYAF